MFHLSPISVGKRIVAWTRLARDEGHLLRSGVAVANIGDKNGHLALAEFDPPITKHTVDESLLEWKEPP